MAYTDSDIQTALEDHPIAGGEAYTESHGKLDPSGADVEVSSVGGLEDALGGSADVIAIADGDYDLTGLQLDIGDKTLVGYRGWDGSEGALLYSNSHGPMDPHRFYRMLYSDGGCRVTGLRLRGHDPYDGLSDSSDESELSNAIQIRGPNAEVDNCEMWGWTWCAIHLRAGGQRATADIHHCHIRKAQMQGYGYGINHWEDSVSDTHHNYFNETRHAINGRGYVNIDYQDIRYNVFGPTTYSHAIDMHCLTENGLGSSGDPSSTDYALNAGGDLSVRRNTFCYDDQNAVGLRGYPWVGISIERNRFVHDSRPSENPNSPYNTEVWYANNMDWGGVSQYPPQDDEGYPANWSDSNNQFDSLNSDYDAAYGVGVNVLDVESGGGDRDEAYYDLSPYVPQEALDLRDSKPDIRQSFDTVDAAAEGYDDRSGDLTELIEDAAANDQLVDLGSGTYEMESSVGANGGTVGVVGDGSDSATIYHVGHDIDYLFPMTAANPVLEGFTVDITEDPDDGLDTDVGVASIDTTSEGWFADVVLRGQRHRAQNYSGNGVETPSSRRMTFLIEASSGATNYIHDCRFPDGGTNEAEHIGTTGHAIGPNADPDHYGLNVWHECHAEGFQDNGFYVNNSPGRNVLWECTARNNAARSIGLGDQDIVIGGRSEITDLPGDRLGQCLALTGGDNIQVYGIELHANSADHASDSMLQIRDSAVGETTNAHFEKVVGHFVAGNAAVRQSGVGTTFKDCYFLDEGSGSSTIRGLYGDTSASGEDLYVHNENGSELWMQGSTDTFEYEGETYADGAWSASEVGFGDPRPLPDFYFSDSTPTEFSFVVEVLDDETGAPIEGASVSVGDEPTATTDSDGFAQIGSLPPGQYDYAVSAGGYNAESGRHSHQNNSALRVSLDPITEEDGTIQLQVDNRDSAGIGDVTVRLYEAN